MVIECPAVLQNSAVQEINPSLVPDEGGVQRPRSGNWGHTEEETEFEPGYILRMKNNWYRKVFAHPTSYESGATFVVEIVQVQARAKIRVKQQ